MLIFFPTLFISPPPLLHTPICSYIICLTPDTSSFPPLCSLTPLLHPPTQQFDAVLHDGSDAKQYHNVYPQEWARINHEAKQELLEQQRGGESAPPKGWLYALNRKTSLPAAQAQAKEGEGAGMGAGTGKGTGIGAGAGAGKSTDTGIGAGFGINASDLVYFMRSAWLQSPPLTSVFWLGDQLVSWDR
jgi:hypothetical protein